VFAEEAALSVISSPASPRAFKSKGGNFPGELLQFSSGAMDEKA